MKPFYGLDVTHILTGTNDCDKALSDRMTTFYISRTDLIVGRFHLDTSIDEVTMDDVKQHSSVIDGAWVVVADDVFNITSRSRMHKSKDLICLTVFPSSSSPPKLLC